MLTPSRISPCEFLRHRFRAGAPALCHFCTLSRNNGPPGRACGSGQPTKPCRKSRRSKAIRPTASSLACRLHGCVRGVSSVCIWGGCDAEQCVGVLVELTGHHRELRAADVSLRDIEVLQAVPHGAAQVDATAALADLIAVQVAGDLVEHVQGLMVGRDLSGGHEDPAARHRGASPHHRRFQEGLGCHQPDHHTRTQPHDPTSFEPSHRVPPSRLRRDPPQAGP